MSRSVLACVLAAVAALAGCARKPPPPPPPPLAYVVGPAWQANGVWVYPREDFSLDETGLATVIGAGHPRLTTDNELYDPTAMAAALPDTQLPAIATVTNLDNGLAVRLRVNDRGPASVGRAIAVTPRVALLLRIADGSRVRIQFDTAMSEAVAHQAQGRAADLAIEAAPRGAVQQATLAPLAGSSQETLRAVRGGPAIAAAPETAVAAVPLRLPEQLVQTYADPGVLMIDAGSFTHGDSARRRMLILGDTDARIRRSAQGRSITYDVQAGPYPDAAAADAVLARMLRDGVTDARIVVELR